MKDIAKLYNKPAAGKPLGCVEHEFELFKKLNATRLQYVYVAGFNSINEMEEYCQQHQLSGDLHYAYYQNYTYGILGWYGNEYGWEEVTSELNRREANIRLQECRDNEPKHQFKISKYRDKH